MIPALICAGLASLLSAAPLEPAGDMRFEMKGDRPPSLLAVELQSQPQLELSLDGLDFLRHGGERYGQHSGLMIHAKANSRLRGVEGRGAPSLTRIRESGSVSWKQYGYVGPGKQRIEGRKDYGGGSWETLWMDTDGRSGAAAAMVIVGGHVGFLDRPVSWRIQLGKLSAEQLQVEGNVLYVRPKGSKGASVRIQLAGQGAERVDVVPATGKRSAYADIWVSAPPEEKMPELRRSNDFDLELDIETPKLNLKDGELLRKRLEQVMTSNSMGSPMLKTKSANQSVLVITAQVAGKTHPALKIPAKNQEAFLSLGPLSLRYDEYLIRVLDEDPPTAPPAKTAGSTAQQSRTTLPSLYSAEHPFLLFSKEDLPRLREALKEEPLLESLKAQLQLARTEGFSFHSGGEAFMQSLWAVGEAFLYQLEGDPQRAEQAAEYVWSAMYGSLANKNQWRQSYRILGVALSYDLCGEAWDPAFQRQVYNFLFRQTAQYHEAEADMPLWDPEQRFRYGSETLSLLRHERHSNGVRYRLASSLGALAIHKDALPFDLIQSESKALEISPEALQDLAPGLPVHPLTHGVYPKSWLINGPFDAALEDPLSSIGGLAQARPVPGVIIPYEEELLDFRNYRATMPWKEEISPKFYPRNCMKYVTSSTGNGYPAGKRVQKRLAARRSDRTKLAVVLYTVVEVSEEGEWTAHPNDYHQSRKVRMWLNGIEVVDGQRLRLKPGRYAWMVHMPLTGGYATQAPHFRRLDAERLNAQADALKLAKKRMQEQPDILLDWVSETDAVLQRYLELQDEQGWRSWTLPQHQWPFLRASQRLGRPLPQALPKQLSLLPDYARHLDALVDTHSIRLQLQGAIPFLGDRAAEARALDRSQPWHSRRPSEMLMVLLNRADPAQAAEDSRSPFEQPDAKTWVLRSPLSEHERPRGLILRPEEMELLIAGCRPFGRTRQLWVDSSGPDAEELYRSRIWVPGQELAPPQELQVEQAEAPGRYRAQLRQLSPDKKQIIERSIYCAADGSLGAPLVLLVRDRFVGFSKDDPKHISLALQGNLKNSEWHPGKHSMEIRESREGEKGSIFIQALPSTTLKGGFRMYDNNNPRGALRLIMDPEPEKRPGIDVSSPDMILDGAQQNLMDSFTAELEGAKRQSQTEDAQLFWMISLQHSGASHPTLEGSWDKPILNGSAIPKGLLPED